MADDGPTNWPPGRLRTPRRTMVTDGQEDESGNASDPDSVTPGPTSEAGFEVSVPLNKEFRVDDISYEILNATARPDADGKLALVMSLRGHSYRDYDANFWDASFDVTAGEDIYPASGGLNELLPANATQKGDVLFVLPDNTREGTLTMRFDGDTKRTIPFQIQPT
jgi:hypothetical protein